MPEDNSKFIRNHRRQWRDCLYVYPVISRRSRGLSIGVNLSPAMKCSFGCVYCQVDRSLPRGLKEVDLPVLRAELEAVCREAAGGEIWRTERFRDVPPELRRINDIAFSGDGEPTALPAFDKAVEAAADVRRRLGLAEVKLIVITNATHLDSPQFARALPVLDSNNGEIWAKLDAGDEELFRFINRPAAGITLAKVVRDITAVASGRPVVIQTLMMRLHGQTPSLQTVASYIDRLNEIISGGGKIKLVQLHTIARPPAEGFAQPLTKDELESIAAKARDLTNLTIETYV